MPSASWTYSDWDTAYADGSADQLARLKLHIKEVADKISSGAYDVEGKSNAHAEIGDYLARLEARRDSLAAAVSAAAGTRSAFTRGRAI